ncbi:MAG TPA: tRNA uridine-5-carboxymethylaminomethyl(34) synthesis GTPase MnmE [Sphingopyxis sp.]|nr:tRNA uridine-5-carboxymethylaminomethyl(34) synthesis GTPase MnmE [Sphingopyxis sp.]
MHETIYALSSGMPPAAIAVIRISGAAAGQALMALAGRLPKPRQASLAQLRDQQGNPLDLALTLWFPGPATATGEDLAELHLHGGRAVVAAVEKALGAMANLRPAVAGEFTRRSFMNGRIDLAEAEGLADLLAAETESQRVQALAMASGHISQAVAAWQDCLLGLMAQAEAELNFADEDDVETGDVVRERILSAMADMRSEWQIWLDRPAAEVIADGLSVVIAGPPNAGKSTLINALVQRELAIVSPVAGTTRDVVETSLSLGGIAMRFSDTAGIRSDAADAIEAMGIDRAKTAIKMADLLLWLGEPEDIPDHPHRICVAAQQDVRSSQSGWENLAALSDISISAATGEGMSDLHDMILAKAAALLPREGEAALRKRQRVALADALHWLTISKDQHEAGDLILIAERLRLASSCLSQITGGGGVEDMLDALFGRFCIGK